MGKKILLIEDDLPLQRMYQAVFKKSGIEVASAIDGDEGLEKAKSEKPDLILLDLVLPQKDGFEVLERLKSQAETKQIPVIILTVLHQQEDFDRCKKLGAEKCLTKTDILPEQVVSIALQSL